MDDVDKYHFELYPNDERKSHINTKGLNKAIAKYTSGLVLKHFEIRFFIPSFFRKIQVVSNEAIKGPNAPMAR